MKKEIIILASVVICLLTSCGTMKSQYDIVHKNVGKENLDEVSISYGSFQSGCGFLGSSFEKHHSRADYEAEIPREATARWKRIKDGKQFEKTVKVKSVIPDGRFQGKLIFLFDNDDVKLTWQTWKDWYGDE